MIGSTKPQWKSKRSVKHSHTHLSLLQILGRSNCIEVDGNSPANYERSMSAHCHTALIRHQADWRVAHLQCWTASMQAGSVNCLAVHMHIPEQQCISLAGDNSQARTFLGAITCRSTAHTTMQGRLSIHEKTASYASEAEQT